MEDHVRFLYRNESVESLVANAEALLENIPELQMAIVNQQLKLQTIKKMITEKTKTK